TIEDKILVPKPPKNCARCTRYGYLVDGPHCQGCALLHQELKENLVTQSPDFQNTFEPSNASTNVVNAPREPYVIKQDNGSFVDEIIFDLNRAPDLPNQFHCFHCKDVLRDGEACKKIISETSSHTPSNINHCFYECGDPLDDIFCKRCTCAKCGSGLGKELCYICGYNQNSLNDSPRISETSSHTPSNINHCFYECVPVISIPEPCNNQTIDELPQALPIFHPTFHSEAESPFTLDSTPTYGDESPNVFNPPPQPPVYPCEFCGNDAYFGHYCTPQAPFIYPEPCYNKDFNFPQNFQNVPQQYPCCDDCEREEKQIEEEQAAKAQSLKLPVCYDDDDDEESSNSLENNIIPELPPYSAVTPTEPIDSLSMGDEHLNTIPTTESNEFIKSCVENLVPNPSESKGKNGCDIDSLFDEFTGELTHLESIPPGIDETDCHPEEEIRLTKRLLYDNSSPRPLEEIVSDNSDADIESFSPSPIPVEDRTLNIKMMGDVSEVPIPNLMITLVLNQEKSPDLLSHQGFEAFQPSAECPM
nr:hypothetical protein [Tanacetum cinerariifolium]